MFKTFGRYSHAIVSRVPSSFVTAIGSSDCVNLQEARREHSEYTKILRSLGLDVIELPADENFPDSPFVEDTVVVCNGNALICKPGHPARAKEVQTIRTVIKKELNLPMYEITDPRASLDGGDVLFTGREFFVGISNRTNERGAMELASAFPEYPVTPIRVPTKFLHLKSCVTMAGPDILCISSSPEARDVLKKIEREASFRYATITVPDDDAANVIFVNGTLIYRSEFPRSRETIEKRVDFPKIPLKIWELSESTVVSTATFPLGDHNLFNHPSNAIFCRQFDNQLDADSMAGGDGLVQKLQDLLKIKENELNESKKTATRLESECGKLRKYNSDLIKQIDLTNHKLHVLLGVCEKREDKETQTENDSSPGGQKDDSVGDQEKVPLKAADWAKIAQEVVDSNDYVYEPTSKTYYSLSTGWYYYPNEKIFFDPKTKNYYRYDAETKNYVIYPVDRDATKKTLANSSGKHSSGQNPQNKAEKEDSEEGEIISSSEESDVEDLNETSDVEEDETNISCLRMIVQKSSSLEIGSLLLVTCKGALLGKDSKCDLLIDDLTISPHHARISYDAKFKCYQVIDCSSDHGVYLNDFKLGPEQSHNISHGDVIRLGDCEFLLHHHPGREVTCINCEPGCVQAEFQSRAGYTPVGVLEGDTKTLNRRLKKMYGITWEDENIVSLPVNYSDRAKKRQKTVGSTNPHEKTGEGTSLVKPLTKKNRGFKMLEKLGWQEGNALGKTNSGNKEPLPLISSEGRYGLGYSGRVS